MKTVYTNKEGDIMQIKEKNNSAKEKISTEITDYICQNHNKWQREIKEGKMISIDEVRRRFASKCS